MYTICFHECCSIYSSFSGCLSRYFPSATVVFLMTADVSKGLVPSRWLDTLCGKMRLVCEYWTNKGQWPVLSCPIHLWKLKTCKWTVMLWGFCSRLQLTVYTLDFSSSASPRLPVYLASSPQTLKLHTHTHTLWNTWLEIFLLSCWEGQGEALAYTSCFFSAPYLINEKSFGLFVWHDCPGESSL